MAESKKSSTGKSKEPTNAELAEQLRRAAEILDAAEKAEKKPAAKKPAAKSASSKTPAKKPTTKKPATKAQSTSTKKATPKKEAEPAQEEPVAESKPAPKKKPATKQAAVKDQPQAAVQAEEPVIEEEPVTQEPATQPPVAEEPADQPVAEQPVAEEPTVEQAAAEQPEAQPEAQPEQPPVQQADEQENVPAPAPEPDQPVKVKAARGERANAFMNKSNDLINKWGLPLFIVANSLLLLSSIFLIIGAFSLSYTYMGTSGKVTCSVFQYFGNAKTIKYYWQGTAGEWTDGAFVMVGILMFIAFLGPLALIAKNVVLFILKKDKQVHMLDAIVTFAFILAYLGVVNLFGANTTWAHIIAFIASIVLLAYTIFVILLNNREGSFPFFSLANLLLITLCMFLLTSNKIYDMPGGYASLAAGATGAGGFAFIMLLFCLAAMVLLIVMQVKKLPGKIAWLFEFLVPAVIGVLALIALISFAGGKPNGVDMGGGYVFGSILAMLFAIADVVFALVPQLHKFNVKVTDRMPAAAAVQPVQPVQPVTEQVAPEQPAPAQPTAQANVCPSCGTQNRPDDLFCARCGRRLK